MTQRVSWRVPFFDLDIGPEERRAVNRVLDSDWLSMGPVTEEFEQRFSEYIGTRHGIAVSSGTAALHLALLALGVGRGDEVIVPSLCFVAVANAVRHAGAQPVFADVLSATHLGIGCESIEAGLTPRTRCIIAMHYGGYSCDLPGIQEIAARNSVALIEDTAHAPGAELGLRKLGGFGDAGCFSFFANKNLSTGEGGMLVTNRDDIARCARRLRSHGMTSSTWDRYRGEMFSYDVVATGYNYRIDEMRAALGVAQLAKLDAGNRRRREITTRYRAGLQTLSGVSITCSDHDGISAAHLFPILLDAGRDREAFMGGLRACGVQSSIHYPPIHRLAVYRDPHAGRTLPVTDDVAARIVSLPLYPGMDDSCVDTVVDAVRASCR